MAAIAVKGEKNTPYTVRRGGYTKRCAGAWQQDEGIHGKVPKDPIGQALKAESYLIDLIQDKPIDVALNIYGGDKTKKEYAYNVLAELKEVP